MSLLVVACTARSIKPFQLVGSIRPTSQPVLLAIGYLDLHRKNTTPVKDFDKEGWKKRQLFHTNTILQTYMWEPLCCPNMLRTFLEEEEGKK